MTNTKVYLAVYKGTKDGKGANIQLVRLTDWAIRKITRGAYSHCEIAVNLGGKYECFSASLRDGGVRRKLMYLQHEKWDLIELPEAFAEQARALYRKTLGAKYDTWGVFATVLPRVQGSRDKCGRAGRQRAARTRCPAGRRQRRPRQPGTLTPRCRPLAGSGPAMYSPHRFENPTGFTPQA